LDNLPPKKSALPQSIEEKIAKSDAICQAYKVAIELIYFHFARGYTDF
jgi:hypothetical protein